MKHNCAKTWLWHWTLNSSSFIILKVDKLANILINDCQIYNNLLAKRNQWNTCMLLCIIVYRFKVIPIGVIWTKLFIVKSLILLIITTINMIIIILYTFRLSTGFRVDVYVSTSITVHYHICYLSCMILWLINFHHHWISLMSTPWNKFYLVLVNCICHLILLILCFKKNVIYNWISICISTGYYHLHCSWSGCKNHLTKLI